MSDPFRGTASVGRPQSNGFLERFHRTMLDEHLRIQGRTTFYEDLPQMQNDLDAFLHKYNCQANTVTVQCGL